MDNLLMLFGEELQERYNTVMENIRNASNSFFDSYNSMVEEFFRENTIQHVKGSISNIIKDKMNKDFILNDVQLDPRVYNKILDIAAKINSHKHKRQKIMNINFVVNYMAVFYDIVFAFAKYKKFTIPKYNEDFYVNNYNSYAKDKKEVQDIADKVDFIASHFEKQKKNEEAYIFKRDVIKCGIYGYESVYSTKKYRIFKYTCIALNLLTLSFFIKGVMSGGEQGMDFFYSSLIFLIYYFIRFISLIFLAKCEPARKSGGIAYLRTQLTSDGVPYTLGGIKFYFYVINILYVLCIIGISYNVWTILYLISFIITWILTFMLRKSYYVTVLYSKYGIYYFDPITEKMININEDGSL